MSSLEDKIDRALAERDRKIDDVIAARDGVGSKSRADEARERLNSLKTSSKGKAYLAALVGAFGFWLAYVIGRAVTNSLLGAKLHDLNVYLREAVYNRFTDPDAHGVGWLSWPDSSLKSFMLFVLVLVGMYATAKLAFNRESVVAAHDKASARPTPRVVLGLLIVSILAAVMAVSSGGAGRGQEQIRPTNAAQVKVLQGQEAAAKATLDEANSKVNSAEATLSNALVALRQAKSLRNNPAEKIATQAIAQAKSAKAAAVEQQRKAATTYKTAQQRVTDAQLGNCPKGKQPSGDPKNPCKAGTSSGSQ